MTCLLTVENFKGHLALFFAIIWHLKSGSPTDNIYWVGKWEVEVLESSCSSEVGKGEHKIPQLQYEFKIYKILKGTQGVPAVKWFTQEGEFNVLVMEMLEPSLEDLFNYCGRRFSLRTVCLLADQMLDRIEKVHWKLFIHIDIKPDNFLIGLNENFNVVLLSIFKTLSVFAIEGKRDQKKRGKGGRGKCIHTPATFLKYKIPPFYLQEKKHFRQNSLLKQKHFLRQLDQQCTQI
ncbi:hypothetical protein RFI_28585 [Reticulomyxa filosa]|uniref:Casein kinase I n=1 Tax=Reticulomyxa filosa TaxID=46433 RepID=X6M599_RETFI|nr:hypothetical protein RFI_28585 [Reticulomyxa filosa]|eukprot:ETO08801.1 hypothetical protein RFI_28585 [Reticulomyxa filosa]